MAQPEDQTHLHDDEIPVVAGASKNESVTNNTENMFGVVFAQNTQTKMYRIVKYKSIDDTHSDLVSGHSALETLNNDCLLQICEHLILKEVFCLAATCTRLENFANSFYFPRKAKVISVDIRKKIVLLTALLDKECRPFKVKGIPALLSYLGVFIEDLTFLSLYGDLPNIWCSWAIIIERCQNLKTIRLNHWRFKPDQTHGLQDQMDRFENIKELDLLYSSGVTNNWRATVNLFSKVEKLTISAGDDEINDHFIEHFRNLSSLKVDFNFKTPWQTDDLSKMFDNNGHCLQQLKLSNLSLLKSFECVGQLITDKLPKLESLSLQFDLTSNSKHLIELPHLKCLELDCAESSINYSLLRTLSDNGIVEKLRLNQKSLPDYEDLVCSESSLNERFFYDEDDNARPLIFNNLKTFHWLLPTDFAILKSITRAQMPVITNFSIFYIYPDRCDLNGLFQFIESKRTLKNIQLLFNLNLNVILSSFFCQIIRMLEESGTPKRPFLNFVVYPLRIGKEEVSKFT